MTPRPDGRAFDQLRQIELQSPAQFHPLASVMTTFGRTRVLCAVSEELTVPGWMRAEGRPGGWVTAEYRMLPGATDRRSRREGPQGPGGRSQEIQRLIGRSLRAVVDLAALGQRTLYVDCDVVDADGGTRCAAICGAYVALRQALDKLVEQGQLETSPVAGQVAAVSVGILDGRPMLDLCYEEDSAADVDMNVVMTGTGEFVEVQGTAEGEPFSEQQMQSMLDLARRGVLQILDIQRAQFG
jgi:ribonuclease PH